MVKAVIFDWSGTIIDYGCMAPAAVFVEIFNQKGIALSFEEARGPMGMAKIDHMRELLMIERIKREWNDCFGKYPDEEDLMELYREFTPVMTQMVMEYSGLIRGVPEVVEKLHIKGIKIGSTTGYTDEMMTELIPAARKQGFDADSIVLSSHVPAGRPAPWGIFLNAQKMNVYPLSAMVKIGDTPADIKEGINADMWTIACTKSGNEIGLPEKEVEKLDPGELNKRMENASRKFKDLGAHYIIEGVWDCVPVIEEIEERIRLGEKPA